MTGEPARARTNAERSRLFRERRRPGLRVIEIQVFESEIAALVAAGLLDAAMHNDAGAIEVAIEQALAQALRPWRS